MYTRYAGLPPDRSLHGRDPDVPKVLWEGRNPSGRTVTILKDPQEGL